MPCTSTLPPTKPHPSPSPDQVFKMYVCACRLWELEFSPRIQAVEGPATATRKVHPCLMKDKLSKPWVAQLAGARAWCVPGFPLIGLRIQTKMSVHLICVLCFSLTGCSTLTSDSVHSYPGMNMVHSPMWHMPALL